MVSRTACGDLPFITVGEMCLFSPENGKGPVFFGHSDFGIIGHRGGNRKQKYHDFFAHFFFGEANQFLSDAVFLVIGMDRQVGEVTTPNPIRDRAGNPDQQVAVPGGYDQIGMVIHLLYAFFVLGRSRQTRSIIERYDLVSGGSFVKTIFDGHGGGLIVKVKDSQFGIGAGSTSAKVDLKN